MKTSMTGIIAMVLLLAGVSPGKTPTPAAGPPRASNRIDEAVFRRLSVLRIKPASLCPDHVFFRRVYFDVIGTLPAAEEVIAFLKDKAGDKRAKLIDRLLDCRGYADFQAMRWSDLLRIKSEFPINLWPNAAHAYYQYIWASLRGNKPYDQLARELLTSSGSNFRVAPVNFYRAIQGAKPMAMARAAALTFLGVQAEKWSETRLAGLAAFFGWVGFKRTAEWKEEIVFFDSSAAAKETATGPKVALLPDGSRLSLAGDRDPRELFADWLLKRGNKWFARNMVNRIWYWLMGRGIIHEPDDIRQDNRPRNPALLALLEEEFVRSRYDIKHIFRVILNSRIYQQSCVPESRSPVVVAEFGCYPVRRLEAEVLIDALCSITGTNESYSSKIPEPFTFIPENQRSITLPDGSINSSFLEQFGRPSRDTGFIAERNNKPTASQRLHLLNSSHIRNKIEKGGKLRSQMARFRRKRGGAVDIVYLSVLSRYPTIQERKLLQGYSRQVGGSARRAVFDLVWALINTVEFQYRH